MKIDNKIRDGKLQCNINREASKMSTASSAETDKYKYLTSKEILPSSQSGIKKQANFADSPFGKAFEKQIKTIEDQGGKQIKAFEGYGKQLIKSNREKESLTIFKQKSSWRTC